MSLTRKQLYTLSPVRKSWYRMGTTTRADTVRTVRLLRFL
jgi:hypothetical protein